MSVKRLYWVGLNNRMGRLQYWYYKKRGWIYTAYYVKPKQPTWLEWLHCLVSPSHTQATWLRLTPEAEERALHVLKVAVIALFAAAALTGSFYTGERHAVHYFQSQPRQIQIHLRTGEQTI